MSRGFDMAWRVSLQAPLDEVSMPTKTKSLWTIAGTLLAAALLTSCNAHPSLGRPNAPIREAGYSGRIKVACVGDSITQGSGTTAYGGVANAFPAQLQRMLGDKYEVGNFGVSGATLLKRGDKPYWKESAFNRSKAYRPDVVILMLGTNDTKPQNWSFQNEFADDYSEMVRQYQTLDSTPRVFVCHPCVVSGANNYSINEANVLLEIPLIDSVARSLGAGVIDIHGATLGHEDLLPDHVHPNNGGANLLARTVYEVLKGKPPENAPAAIAAPLGTPR
jgi:acyl-CoA thioesterase I